MYIRVTKVLPEDADVRFCTEYLDRDKIPWFTIPVQSKSTGEKGIAVIRKITLDELKNEFKINNSEEKMLLKEDNEIQDYLRRTRPRRNN